jgi:hypothetical protein
MTTPLKIQGTIPKIQMTTKPAYFFRFSRNIIFPGGTLHRRDDRRGVCYYKMKAFPFIPRYRFN